MVECHGSNVDHVGSSPTVCNVVLAYRLKRCTVTAESRVRFPDATCWVWIFDNSVIVSLCVTGGLHHARCLTPADQPLAYAELYGSADVVGPKLTM